MEFKRWLSVGQTKEKAKALDPIFDKTTDNTIYELPPVWTDLDVPLRGPGGSELKGGCWVSINNVPAPPEKFSMLIFKCGTPPRYFSLASTVALGY